MQTKQKTVSETLYALVTVVLSKDECLDVLHLLEDGIADNQQKGFPHAADIIVRGGVAFVDELNRQGRPSDFQPDELIAVTLNVGHWIDVRMGLTDGLASCGIADTLRPAADHIRNVTQEAVSAFDAAYEAEQRETALLLADAGHSIFNVIAAAFVALTLMFGGSAMAQETPFVPYDKALSECSAQWRASEERAKAQKGERAAAWQKFRADCVVKQGYQKGRKAPPTA